MEQINQAGTVQGVCGHCDAVLEVPRGQASKRCPYCGQATMSGATPDPQNPLTAHAPELAIPFTTHMDRVRTGLHQFVKETWFSPADMTAGNLNKRLQRFYLPMWLVDADAQARWQAEVGFDYEVVSHREQFRAGQWHTQRVNETKIRWEPRVGTLQRHYANRPAPALEEQKTLERVLGPFQLDEAQPYTLAAAADTVLRYPNRPPDDAWPEAEAAIKRAATDECRVAAAAEHIREFRWSAQFANQHWTQLLLPIFTTHYTDDDGETQMVYVHGQTGRVVGQKRASGAQARKWAWRIGITAGVFVLITFIVGLLGYFMNPDLLGLAGLGLTVSLFTAASAVLPLLLAFYFNTFAYFSAANELRTALRQPVAERE